MNCRSGKMHLGKSLGAVKTSCWTHMFDEQVEKNKTSDLNFVENKQGDGAVQLILRMKFENVQKINFSPHV